MQAIYSSNGRFLLKSTKEDSKTKDLPLLYGFELDEAAFAALPMRPIRLKLFGANGALFGRMLELAGLAVGFSAWLSVWLRFWFRTAATGVLISGLLAIDGVDGSRFGRLPARLLARLLFAAPPNCMAAKLID